MVLGEPIRKASVYSPTTMVLGGREHELLIVIVNCIEELYHTGERVFSMKPLALTRNLRHLPTQPVSNSSKPLSLLELINIFDSEGQPPGSIVRSRRPSGQKSAPVSGFRSQTSCHLESTPDICALLTAHLSSLPEPILSTFLLLPIWDWCVLEEDEADAIQHPGADFSLSHSHARTRTPQK